MVEQESQEHLMVQAGQELNFLGNNSKRLQTSSSSFRYIPSDTIGVSKVIATRTGALDTPAPSKQARNVSKADQVTQVDVTPWHATRYLPRVDDTIIGVVTMKNPEFFTIDINSASTALLNSLEF